MNVSRLLEAGTHRAQATRSAIDARLRRALALFGSAVVASILVILFMELGSYVVLSAYLRA